MPIYEYSCENCGEDFESIQKFSDSPLKVCECGKAGKVTRKVSLSAFHLQGGGWYKDRYGSNSKESDNNGKEAGDGKKTGDGKEAGDGKKTGDGKEAGDGKKEKTAAKGKEDGASKKSGDSGTSGTAKDKKGGSSPPAAT